MAISHRGVGSSPNNIEFYIDILIIINSITIAVLGFIASNYFSTADVLPLSHNFFLSFLLGNIFTCTFAILFALHSRFSHLRDGFITPEMFSFDIALTVQSIVAAFINVNLAVYVRSFGGENQLLFIFTSITITVLYTIISIVVAFFTKGYFNIFFLKRYRYLELKERSRAWHKGGIIVAFNLAYFVLVIYGISTYNYCDIFNIFSVIKQICIYNIFLTIYDILFNNLSIGLYLLILAIIIVVDVKINYIGKLAYILRSSKVNGLIIFIILLVVFILSLLIVLQDVLSAYLLFYWQDIDDNTKVPNKLISYIQKLGIQLPNNSTIYKEDNSIIIISNHNITISLNNTVDKATKATLSIDDKHYELILYRLGDRLGIYNHVVLTALSITTGLILFLYYIFGFMVSEFRIRTS